MEANQTIKMDETMSAHEAVIERMQFAFDGETVEDLQCQPCAEEVVYATFPGEGDTRGVKDGLKGEKRKMTSLEFHEAFGNVDFHPKCAICKSVKGVMRRIRKKVDPHRETRMGFLWSMDICTFSHRSSEGCKYLIVLRDNAPGTCKLIPVARRTTECLAGAVEQ